MATSGLMMFFVERPSFTIQMHPVHKLFGLLMVAAATHIFMNYRSLLSHLKARAVTLYGAVLVVLLVLLYGAAINNKLPENIAEKMDSAAAEAESRH